MATSINIEKENQLINKAKEDKRFFAPIYEHYYTPIYIFIFKKVRNEELAADISSKTFLKAITNLDKYTYKGFPFSSWLYKIAMNEVNMHFRKQTKKRFVEVRDSDLIEIVQYVEVKEKDVHKEVLTILASLPPKQSEIIDLRFFEQYSFKEIGEILSITEANAKMKVYRILDKLKKLLNEKQA